jgi:hypothetical protein
MKRNFTQPLMLTLVTILAILVVYNLNDIHSTVGVSLTKPECDCEKPNQTDYTDLVKAFYDIAIKHSTDKVTAHAYQLLYGLYLSPIRYKNIRMLEIGLGCYMGYGPGKSIIVWKEYFSNVTIDILEYDKICGEPFRKDVNQLFLGDQSDLEFLASIRIDNSYDLIVDDGGHSRKQQIHSLIGLWDILKPGGIYVIEDIYFSLGTNKFQIDYDVSTVEVILHLITLFSKEVEFSKRMDLDVHFKSISKTLLSVNCFAEACVLIKKN